jgi:phosphoserine phosphatase RsbU/P
MAKMGSSSSSYPKQEAAVRADSQSPYVRIQSVTIYVRDLDRSLGFYLGQLGFKMAYDARLESGDRFVAVSPPDGTTVLALIAPRPEAPEYKLIGGDTRVVIISEDVEAKFREWSQHGVRFHSPPQRVGWGGVTTNFEDLDGNSFMLVGVDAMTRAIEDRRRALADRLESERRVAQELEIAKQVQARLFPQTLPPLRTLDYAGICIQARQVGGDYYDFLDLGREKLGLVIGDISGKGIAAALLMANLQANLRSQCAIASDHPRRFLRLVNQLFYENTADHAYAALFFAEYCDGERRLLYANCGHLPAFLSRKDGSLERLTSTGTVMGLFKEWDCTIEERELAAGDTLMLYTDGVPESFNGAGEEFGEQRLMELLQEYCQRPPSALLALIAEEVLRFSSQEQADDITLIAAQCR